MHRSRHTCQRGQASVELAVAFPLLLLIILAGVQFGVWWHAAHVADAAARRGAQAARVELGTARAAQQAAEAHLGRLGTGVVLEPRVSASRSADVVRVEVRGRAQQVVPGLRVGVAASAESAVEAFRPAGPRAEGSQAAGSRAVRR